MPRAERNRNAARWTIRQQEDGRTLAPVRITTRGNMLAQTFWGRSWCTNLERYSDFANRLPRGRTYARNGSVIDLQIAAGKVAAMVSGSEIYEVEIQVTPLREARWRRLCADCGDGIDSLVELLQGRLSDGVMEVLCRPNTGLFPEPAEIAMRCSCPDWATMCKHVAAVLYGVGVRLDSEPELLFTLRQVDQTELVSASNGGVAAATEGVTGEDLAGEDLGAIFGIDLTTTETTTKKKKKKKKEQPRTRKTPATKAKRTPSNTRRKATARDPWITAAELRQRGVPNHVVQGWLNKGLVTHSGERGIYVRTDGAEALVRQYLASTRKGSKGR
ncbi:MAG: hypothetical protein KDC87_14780 [Planctomycetes bacterium]|nr:hypothetical protein [Planctomycetota bacterium]